RKRVEGDRGERLDVRGQQAGEQEPDGGDDENRQDVRDEDGRDELHDYRTGSANEKIGSTSIGTVPAPASTTVSVGGIRSYFANPASARARSPVASCSSSSFASDAMAPGILAYSTR